MWHFPPFRLDVRNQCLWRGDERLALMPKPFAVLVYLVEHAGQLVTQDDLLAAIWPDTHVQPEVLRRYILDMVKRDNLTIRQTYERTLPALGGPVFKGTPTQVADEMEDWWRSKACDGFTLLQPVQPRGLKDFVDLVVPELQRRGIFRREYEGRTLRENLGLPRPENRFFRNEAGAGPQRRAASGART